jgi:hypothetical protein
MAVGLGGVPWLFGQGCRPHRPTRASQENRDLTGSRMHSATGPSHPCRMADAEHITEHKRVMSP